jgi:uncharacterized protein (DUF433 family)
MIIQDIISIDPEILGGTPVFKGTRVPISSLYEHLENGITIDGFLDDFPSVPKESIIQLLEVSKVSILALATTQNFNEDTNRRKSA